MQRLGGHAEAFCTFRALARMLAMAMENGAMQGLNEGRQQVHVTCVEGKKAHMNVNFQCKSCPTCCDHLMPCIGTCYKSIRALAILPSDHAVSCHVLEFATSPGLPHGMWCDC